MRISSRWWVPAMLVVAAGPLAAQGSGDWTTYGGNDWNQRYSTLKSITPANVSQLVPRKIFQTGISKLGSFENTPLVQNGVMYVTTPSLKAVALNAATGKEIWTFDPAAHNNGTVVRLRNRGVAHWKGAEGERIFHFVRDRVYALDAKSGAHIPSFGKAGFIDLREDLGVDPATAVIEMTSPGAVSMSARSSGCTDATGSGSMASSADVRRVIEPVCQCSS